MTQFLLILKNGQRYLPDKTTSIGEPWKAACLHIFLQFPYPCTSSVFKHKRALSLKLAQTRMKLKEILRVKMKLFPHRMLFVQPLHICTWCFFYAAIAYLKADSTKPPENGEKNVRCFSKNKKNKWFPLEHWTDLFLLCLSGYQQTKMTWQIFPLSPSHLIYDSAKPCV